MITFVQGNLFQANAEALVNTVNTVGVMGKGIALQFSRSFPEIVKPYEIACKSGELTVGKVQTVPLTVLDGPKYIINFPTKKHWKGNSRLEYIETGLRSLIDEIRRLNIRSIAVPPLGCGLGGLSWNDVKSRIESVLGQLDDVKVLVFEPAGKPAANEMKASSKKPDMSPGRAALIGLMKRYLAPLLDFEVTLLELHKLMYFLNLAGDVQKLEFEKGMYGPYSKNLRHVLNDIEGHYTSGFGDASEEPGKVLELLPGAAEEAELFLKSYQETQSRFKEVEDLIHGFEDAFGMELLATVHWVASEEMGIDKSVESAIHLVHAWNERKQRIFSSSQIKIAFDRLSQRKWLNKQISIRPSDSKSK